MGGLLYVLVNNGYMGCISYALLIPSALRLDLLRKDLPCKSGAVWSNPMQSHTLHACSRISGDHPQTLNACNILL